MNRVIQALESLSFPKKREEQPCSHTFLAGQTTLPKIPEILLFPSCELESWNQKEARRSHLGTSLGC